jgi:hypothetical protein
VSGLLVKLPRDARILRIAALGLKAGGATRVRSS